MRAGAPAADSFPGLLSGSSEWTRAVLDFSRRRLDTLLRGDAERLRSTWRAAGEFGLFRQPFEERLGGLALAPQQLVESLEALGYGSSNNGLLFSFGAHLWAVTKPIADFGSEALQREFLPGLLDGSCIGAHAASEFHAGSDVMAMTTRYVQAGDDFLLSGAKAWTTNAPVADVFVVFATSDPRLHFRGASAFLVPADTPGLEVLPPERKIGLKDSLMAQVVLRDCRVPRRFLLGQRHRGSEIFRRSLAFERGLILAPYIGVMRRQIERCIEHANGRQQFGAPIGSYQAVAHRIAGMVQRYALSKLITERTAAALYAGTGSELVAALCKLTVSESICSNSQDAMRIFGAAGYMEDSAMDRDILDSLGGLIYSGTSDIQKNIISSQVGVGQR